MTNEEAQAIIDDALVKLGEHFDCVQVLVTWPTEERATAALFRGVGNWYARTGMAREFIERDEADTLTRVLAPEMRKPEDEEP